MQVHLTSPNYFPSFVPQNELFKYNKELQIQGDSKYFEDYLQSEDDSDLDKDLDKDEDIEESLIYSSKTNETISKCKIISNKINISFWKTSICNDDEQETTRENA